MDSSNNQHQQQNSGLLRYRSAPCNFLDDNSCGGFDADKLISRFMVSNSNKKNNTSSNSIAVSQGFRSSEGNKFSLPHSQQLPPQYPRQSLNNSSISTAMQSSFGMVGSSMAMGSEMPARGVSSNLMRQNSSPAGLFSHISAQNGYTSINGIGNYGGFNGTNGDITQSPKRLKSQMSFSSGLPSSLGVLSRISEVPNEGIEASVSDEGKLGNGIGGPRYCSPEFPYVSWGDTSLFSENVTVMKTEPDIDGKLFSGSQNGEFGNRIPTLSHHLSLPKISSELVSMGKILHFQDAVPCKIRAKRGCATHPRSIAERMRRTRISERMRKLQELVPQMDKQTNTSDMLDLAVEYIKDLQKQYKTLSDRQANCKCTDRQKPVQN